MLPTLAAIAGEPDIVEKLKEGHKAGNKTFKVHIDGYNLLPFLKGRSKRIRARASSIGATMAT
jgi:arylsulfatase